MKKHLISILAVILIVIFIGFMTVTLVYASGSEKVVLSLDTEEAEAGSLPDMVVMTIKTNEPIVPIQLSGEAYSLNDGIKIIDILDGDKELCSNSKTGRFAWMNANNEKEVTEFARIVFEIPKDLPVGTYTFGVRYASATDRNGEETLSSVEQIVTFTVTNPQRIVFRSFFVWNFFKWW